MRRALIIALLVFPFVLHAQSQETFKGEHFIEVSGVAEMEVEPNKIVLFIKLKEFEDNRQKVSLEKIDQDFLNALKAADIDRKKLVLAGGGASLEKITKRDQDSFREKTYHLTLSSAAEVERLVVKLEPVKIFQSYIMQLDHTDMQKFKMELKTRALQAAKTKADTLLKSIGSEIGKPLMVREWESGPVQPIAVQYRAAANFSDQLAGEAADESTSFRKIKLHEQVTAQFEIK